MCQPNTCCCCIPNQVGAHVLGFFSACNFITGMIYFFRYLRFKYIVEDWELALGIWCMMSGISLIGYTVWALQQNKQAKRTYANCYLMGSVILPWVGYLVMVIQLTGAAYNEVSGLAVGYWLTIWGASYAF